MKPLPADDRGPDAGRRRKEALSRHALPVGADCVALTPGQKADIEARLRAVPGATDVAFEDHQAAYARMKNLFADEPEKMPDVDPADLPESFVVKMTDQAAVRKDRDSAVRGELKALPGVVDLVIRCTTVDECKENVRRMNSPTPAVSAPAVS